MPTVQRSVEGIGDHINKFTIRKEIFINRGRKTTCYSLGKNVVGYARIYYATKKDAQKGLKKLQGSRR